MNARELDVILNSASSKVKKNTLFLDQQYRIPFSFINRIKDRKADKALEAAYRDSIVAAGDTLSMEALEEYLAEKREIRAAADRMIPRIRPIRATAVTMRTDPSENRRVSR